MSQKINLTKHIIAVSLLFLSAMSFVSCEKYTWDPPKIDETIPVSFNNEILPIFSRHNCVDCHKHGGMDPNLTTDVYNNLINGDYVIPFQPESSSLYTHQITDNEHKGLCSDIEKQKIRAWILQGAKENDEVK